MSENRRKLLKEIGINKYEIFLSYSNWQVISSSGKLSEEFMKEFIGELHWNVVLTKQVLSDDFLIEIQDKMNWTVYFMYANSSFFIMKKFILKAKTIYFKRFKVSHFNEQQINELQRILDLKNIFRKDEIKLEKTT